MPRIKSYLPVRLRIDDVDTFFYVKEHQDGGGKNDTLFVANCPILPRVRTKRLLQSIFGRFGEVARVTVIENPRKQTRNDDFSWTTAFREPSYLPQHNQDNGKFAHVVFDSTKEMKETMRSLEKAMETSTNPFLELETIELQTLADNDTKEGQPAAVSGIQAVAARYRESCRQLDRDKLLEECNRVMQQYEESQEQKKLDAQEQVDDDGFVKVTYKTSEKTVNDQQLDMDPRGRRKKRSRSKKTAEPLTDFYRFQTKEHRKKTVQELRERFESDLARVKRMKQERQYQPF